MWMSTEKFIGKGIQNDRTNVSDWLYLQKWQAINLNGATGVSSEMVM